MLTRKIDLLMVAMEQEDWTHALSIAARFPRLGSHKVCIIRGHEAITNPRFYRQLGKDPDALVAAAIEALKERYSS